MDMDKKDELIWYEITVCVVPNKDTAINQFYVEVNEFKQYTDKLNQIRFGINPRIGKYDNCDEFWEKTRSRNDIKTIIVADTIIDYEEALKLEENLVSGLRSCNEKFGFNKRIK